MSFRKAPEACVEAWLERCRRLGMDTSDPKNFNEIDLNFCIFKDGWFAAMDSKKEQPHE